ncbi:transglycosylase domain-containing protein [Mechercharimyces sp. CAU 1602]|uniref:transglycosylase domain-containing protein n=1 Tax=Mechercharimyces sp. CAU 1602 TaxID=2973933 RepID=UPI002162E034|nr:PBP1A family penicillin-binding protein [Mechercharimyces sp. CAU 1602]MCS1352645.1 PBP1A family penicillin-binding protein [Mechercharimyces sp. CAU 1602]
MGKPGDPPTNIIPSRQRSNKRGTTWIKRTTIACMWGLAIILTCILLLTLYLYSRPLPIPDIPLTTTIVDQHGERIDQLDRGEHRDAVKLKDIDSSLIQATLAAEDHSFYEHWGFSLRGITRAIWVNMRNGQLSQGASTITQQLARNLYLSHERTWTRKWKEALYTIQLELHYTKDEILTMYLNDIYYGHGAYGIERASHLYFHKPARALTLAESSILAGIPRGPKYYSPIENEKRAKQRQAVILRTMEQTGYISKEQRIEAEQTPLSFAPPPTPIPAQAPYFRDYVIKEASQRFGINETDLRSGGFTVITTLDLKKQHAAVDAFKQYVKQEGLEGALVSIEPRTGYIIAMVGGTDYGRSQYNRALAHRQPGSTFKPFLYLAALDQGRTATTKLMSKPTRFTYENGTYEPHNFHNHYADRPISMREAIARSDNIYAVRTHFEIGREKTVEMAQRLGITSKLQAHPSLALGSETVTPLEMANAYATLAAQGIRAQPTSIIAIQDAQGHTLSTPAVAPTRVVSRAKAFLITDLLKSVLHTGGTGNRVKQLVGSIPAVGKTGTTRWDSWFVGYTPDIATSVWIGYDQAKELPYQQSRLSQYIWGTYIKQAESPAHTPAFSIPDGVSKVKIDSETGMLATSTCPQTHTEYFLAGTEPLKVCKHHRPLPTDETSPLKLWESIKNWWSQ